MERHAQTPTDASAWLRTGADLDGEQLSHVDTDEIDGLDFLTGVILSAEQVLDLAPAFAAHPGAIIRQVKRAPGQTTRARSPRCTSSSHPPTLMAACGVLG